MMILAPENSTRDSSISCWMPTGRLPMRGRRIDVEAEAGELLLRLALHARPVDHAAGDHRLRAEKDVLGDGQIGNDRQFLVHHADAGRERVARRAQMDGLAGHPHLALEAVMHAGDDLHHRRFAGAVLADKAVDFALHQREVHVAQRMHAAERLRDADHFEQGRRRS